MAAIRISNPQQAVTGTLAAPTVPVDETDPAGAQIQQALGRLGHLAIIGGDFAAQDAQSILVPVYGSGAPDPTMIESFFYVDSDTDTLYFRAGVDPVRYVAINP